MTEGFWQKHTLYKELTHSISETVFLKSELVKWWTCQNSKVKDEADNFQMLWLWVTDEQYRVRSAVDKDKILSGKMKRLKIALKD